jgi:hypothetical protein|tara:strand:- start:183 stop:644 length:462 start_codon:yes stop_codon:yes gene_type:complete
MAQRKINKVVRQLKKASKTHAGQAKTLESIKMKKGGAAKSSVPSNVANPSLYRKAKAKAKAKFDVYPSAYANAYMVSQYKKMGGRYKGAKKAEGGEMKALKPIPAENKGLPKLPKKVRNKMGFMRAGGAVMVQSRGCGAIMPGKQKKTRVPRS